MDGLAFLDLEDPLDLLVAQAVLNRALVLQEKLDKSRAQMIANALAEIL